MPSSSDNQHQHAEFAITPPPGFVQVKDQDPNVAAEFTLPGEEPNTVRANLTVVTGPTDRDLPAVVDGSRRDLKVAFPDYQPTDDQPVTLTSGQQGWLLGGSYTLRGVPAENLQLLLVADHVSFTFTGVTTRTIFAQFDPVFRDAFRSVTIR